MQSIDVPVSLGERAYVITVGGGLLDQAGALLHPSAPGRRLLLVSDAHVAPLYADRVQTACEAAGYRVARAVVPAGEASKCGAELFRLYDAAVDAGLDRHGVVAALGGGVVGDLAGFMAATYLRGLAFVQLPTTLLAMVDSAVGGKTGINLPHGKNLVGSFHQPVRVLADVDTLATLPQREFSAGMAEVVKHGLIRDAGLFADLEAHATTLRNDPVLLASIVARNCAIKAEVVRIDERESGLRSILNFGHTLGHALEKVGQYGGLLHGEAVSIGCVFAAEVSRRVTGLSGDSVARLRAVLQASGLPVRPEGFSWAAVRKAMAVDKKGQEGRPRWVLAEEIGKVSWGHDVPEAVLQEAWDVVCQ